MSTPSTFVFDPSDKATQRHPFPLFERARREFPVYPHEGLPVVSVFGYADVLRVLRDYEVFSNEIRPAGMDRERPRNMLSSDPPEHTRLRKLVNQAFTPRIVARLEEGLWRSAHELLDDALDRGEVDFIDALAYPLPVIAIAQVLGVPAEDRKLFRYWSDTLISTPGPGGELRGAAPAEKLAEAERVRGEMYAYFERMARERRREPREDLISGLVAAEDEGSRLSFEEMLEMLILLLIAGNETTTNLIGNMAIQLLAHPGALRDLRADPKLLSGAIEETLRFDSPVQADPRGATREVELHGVKIPEKTMVMCWLASANRDEEVFERAHEFDIRREPNRHLSFGFGQHYCLGANLARLEARVAVGALLERTRDFARTTTEDLPLHPSFFFRGFRSIPLRLVAS